jgi:branched-chain amino acid transport system ATP-binding protein
MGRVRSFLHEYRPSVVTGGETIVPLLILAGLNAADELDRSAFALLIPEIRDYFGVSIGTILTVTSMAAVLPILLAIPIGYFADRMPRTKMTGVGAAMWGVFSILTAFAGSLTFLGIFRFGSGLGKTMEPAHLALLSDYYPPERRPGVFAVHRFGNEIGLMVAPLVAGILATAFFWQVPFLIFGVPSLILSVLVFVLLREPVRGAQERRSLGVEDDADFVPEPPPGWTESWRITRSVRTLRRVYMALPFLVGSSLGILALLSVYYDEVFHLSGATRGILASVDRVFGIAGLVVGGVLGNRLLVRRPGRAITYAAAMAVVPAAAFLVIASTPWLAVAVAASAVSSFVLPILGPTLGALMSLTIPPRVRGFALATGGLFIAPGLFVGPLSGYLSDHYGVRAGILVLVPVFLIGAAIFGSAASSVEADMRAAWAAAVAASASRDVSDGQVALVCRDIDVHYGQVQVLFNLDLDVYDGEILALLGTNGAGKSTLLKAIAGTTVPSNGAIFFGGNDISFLPPSEHVERGIVLVPGGRGVFPSLTVRENLDLAGWPFRDDRARVKQATQRVLELFPQLNGRIDTPAAALSGGEAQMLTLGQALIAQPQLLMIDELSLGLAPTVVQQLLEIVREINANGTTIILVEQSVNVALTVADRAVFMEKGEIRFTGPAAELLERGDILRSVFLAGSGVRRPRRGQDKYQLERDEASVVLDVEGVTKSFGGVNALNDAGVVLREGEVVGLIGPNGAGKTTLFDVISGFVQPDQGRVTLLGDDITDASPDQRALLGLQRSFQDATLFPALTVTENLLVALDRHLQVKNAAMAGLRLPNVNRAEWRLNKRAERLIGLLNLEAYRDKFVRELSTGGRRMVDLACVLGTDPHVLLLDEPSSGIAQRETEELGPLIQRIKTETACSILIIEHDMPLISAVADELIAMDLGAPVVRGTPAEVLADQRVIDAYLGTSREVIQRSGRIQ